MAGHALTGDLIFEGTDPRVVQLMQNCDGQGMSLRQLASQLLQLIIRDGGVHILIDQDENGGRPLWMQGLRSTPLSNGAGCGKILKIFPISN